MARKIGMNRPLATRPRTGEKAVFDLLRKAQKDNT